MSGPTLNLPSDPAAIEQAAAVIAEYDGNERAHSLARRWAAQVAPDRADELAASVIAELRPSPGAEPVARIEVPDGPKGAAHPPLIELESRVRDAEASMAPPVQRWDPDRQAVVSGRVAVSETIAIHGRDGPQRCLTIVQANGEPVEVWCSWVQLRSAVRRAEVERGRALRTGDLLAIRFAGSERGRGHQQASRLFALAIAWGKD